jgi:hypothetical protein
MYNQVIQFNVYACFPLKQQTSPNSLVFSLKLEFLIISLVVVMVVCKPILALALAKLNKNLLRTRTSENKT